jgi:hypothetical protein
LYNLVFKFVRISAAGALFNIHGHGSFKIIDLILHDLKNTV